jgi:transposase
MLVTRAYKTELDLTNEQATVCKQHAGAARFAYNWGLIRRQEVYKATGKGVWAMELHRELNTLKKTDLAWMYEVSKCAPQEGLRNLDTAFRHFFRRCQLKKAGQLKGKVGYPKLKSKKKGLGSFRLTGSIVIFPKAIQLPRLGRLRLKEKEYLPTKDVKILSATISEEAGHWYVSVQVAEEREESVNRGPVVGGRPGAEGACHPLRWDGHPQPASLEAETQETQAAAPARLPQKARWEEPPQGGTTTQEAVAKDTQSTPEHAPAGHGMVSENQANHRH